MKAFELLEKPESWCQGMFAKTKEGIMVHPISPNASQWCISGAIHKVYRDDHVLNSAELEAFRKLLDVLDYPNNFYASIVGWNDDSKRTHAEVLALLKEAGV